LNASTRFYFQKKDMEFLKSGYFSKDGFFTKYGVFQHNQELPPCSSPEWWLLFSLQWCESTAKHFLLIPPSGGSRTRARLFQKKDIKFMKSGKFSKDIFFTKHGVFFFSNASSIFSTERHEIY